MQWCRRDDKDGAEKYVECACLGEYLAADAFLKFVHERAIYTVSWQQSIELISRSAMDFTVRLLAAHMLDDATFVFGNRSKVRRLLTHAVLDKLLDICDFRLRFGQFKRRRSHSSDSSDSSDSDDSGSDKERVHTLSNGRAIGVSRLLYQLFIRFVRTRKGGRVGIWLRRTAVRRKIVALLRLSKPHICRLVRRFLRKNKKWRYLMQTTTE